MDTTQFDPNGTGIDNGNYFGLPFDPEQCDLVLVSVPWDVTASYGGGTAYGPDAIIGASTQLDLYEPLFPQGWRRGIGTVPIDYSIQERSGFLREDAVKVMKHLEHGGVVGDDYVRRKSERINAACGAMNAKVKQSTQQWLDKGKIVGLVGGDHSTPLGLLHALSERHDGMSVLHVDAHADLRPGYEGFIYSHASIMYNILEECPGVDMLVQVGIRDLCDAEAEYAEASNRVEQVTDYELASNRFRGMNWDEQCDRIIGKLGKKVYISFDVDGLSPDNSPHTGTPVPGGLAFNEAVYLIDRIASSGRTLIGFDLCEVAPGRDNEWDANVGARMLYKLCNLTLKSHQEQAG